MAQWCEVGVHQNHWGDYCRPGKREDVFFPLHPREVSILQECFGALWPPLFATGGCPESSRCWDREDPNYCQIWFSWISRGSSMETKKWNPQCTHTRPGKSQGVRDAGVAWEEVLLPCFLMSVVDCTLLSLWRKSCPRIVVEQWPCCRVASFCSH